MPSHPAIQSIYRYPVKGLLPQPIGRTMLVAGETSPCDRRYAIDNGPAGFDPDRPAYFPIQRFLMQMRDERLAAVRPVTGPAAWRSVGTT